MTVLAAILATAASANVHDRSFYEEKFFNWLQEHKSVVARDGKHFVEMLMNFANNEDLIQATNKKNLSYKLGHNQFSHMSVEQFREHVKLGLAKRPEQLEGPASIHKAPADVSSLGTAVDWVEAGAVTDVKDQGQCGSCWSFSTTGALEGAYYNKFNTLKSFSEQNLVDCDTYRNGGSDLGCNGGLMDSAFAWTQKNGGLCTEDDYPYVSGTTKERGDCVQSSCSVVSGVAPKSYTDVEKNSDAAMMSALNKQPVSIAIEADQAAFQLYSSGVFTAECGTSLDHGVLAVGYGTYTDGTDYYKVKNSWGSGWGMDGYILLERGVSQKEGQCGMLSGPPSYPNL